MLLDLRSLWEAVGAALRSDADAATVAELAIQIALLADDAASVADAVAQIALQDAELGAALDAALQVALSHADAAAGAESVSGIALSRDEAVFAGDAANQVGLSSSDIAAQSEAVFAVGVGAPDTALSTEAIARLGLGDAELVSVSDLASISVILTAIEDASAADAVLFVGQLMSDDDFAFAVDEVGELVFIVPPAPPAIGTGYMAPRGWLEGEDLDIYMAALGAMLGANAIDAEEMTTLMTMAWTEPLRL